MDLTRRLKNGRAVIVAAHPDDETAGLGGFLPFLQRPIFVHVTDGAPRDMRDACANGFPTRVAYARARREEFRDALEVCGIQPSRVIDLDYVDQEAALHLADLSRQLSRLFLQLPVNLVLVHPYEGGHPDHDATAFGVHLACRLLEPQRRPEIVEFTSYHIKDGVIVTGCFLPNSGLPETIISLDTDTRLRKERMLACFRTQQPTLRYFSCAEERFRVAPTYDFTAPPHPGRLFYEQFQWGMSRSRWTTLAQNAEDELR